MSKKITDRRDTSLLDDREAIIYLIEDTQEAFFKKVRQGIWIGLLTLIASIVGVAFWMGSLNEKITSNRIQIELHEKELNKKVDYQLYMTTIDMFNDYNTRVDKNFDSVIAKMVEMDKEIKSSQPKYRGIKIEEKPDNYMY